MQRPGGASSAYLIEAGEAAVLFDIGSGAAAKLAVLTDPSRLDAVVITHMHADHFFDLVPLRYAFKYGEAKRDEPLAVWVPPGGRGSLDALRKAVSIDTLPDFFDAVFSIREYDPTRNLRIKDLELSFCRTRHYVEGYAIRSQWDDKSLTYSSDTAPCDAVVDHARRTSLFLCEAALGLSREDGQRGHSSAAEAGEMAARAQVERLVLTHYAACWSPAQLVAAAGSVYSGLINAADDGIDFVV